ncbi:MAG TPA: hypothetical protein PL033_17120 [Candidatus Brocadiia bacterium]|nr:hypothetical protein [Candidatus Brocadiia bacterium]
MAKREGTTREKPYDGDPDESESRNSGAPGLTTILAGIAAAVFLILWALGWPAKGEGMEWFGDGGYRFEFLSNAFSRVILPLAHLCVIVLAAFCGGLRLMSLLRAEPDSAFERVIFGVASGLGALSIGIMILGCLGFPQIWVLELAMAVAGFKPAIKEFERIQDHFRSHRNADDGVGAWQRAPANRGLFPALAAGGIFLFFGWMAAQTPPFEYDALEYHLGLPARYVLAGRIPPIPESVFANFPQNAEMIYYAGMLHAGIEDGARVGLLVMLLFAAITAAAIGRLCVMATGRDAGAWAGVFWLVCPTVCASIATDSDSLVVTCYCALAMAASLTMPGTASPSEKGDGSTFDRAGRYCRLCGAMCGFAIGAKYPALLCAAVPAFALLSWRLLALRRQTSVESRRLIAPLMGFALCAGGMLLPWLVKNAAYTGNPVYPFLYGIFGGEGWTELQAVRFSEAHSWRELSISSAPGRLVDFLLSRSLADHHVNPLAVVFIPLACAFALAKARQNTPSRDEKPALIRITAGSLAWFAVCFALWFLATHRIDRFLSWALPSLALCSGVGYALWEGGWGRVAKPALVGILLAFGAFENARSLAQTGGFEAAAGFDASEETLRRLGILEHRQAMDYLNEAGGGAKTMFIGEARTFHARFPVVAPTVFNRHPIDEILGIAREDPKRAMAALRESGVEYVLINWAELSRLQATYAVRDAEGKPRCLFENLDAATLDPFPQLSRAGLTRVMSFGEPAMRQGFGTVPLPVIDILKAQR